MADRRRCGRFYSVGPRGGWGGLSRPARRFFLLDSRRRFAARERRRVVFASTPPDEIITADDARALRPPLLGIRHDEMNTEQQVLLRELIETFARRFAPQLAEARMAAVEAGGLAEVRFGWAGSGTPESPYYFRIHGPGFVIEQGTFEGDPDHQHSVWRSFDDDFGREDLRATTPRTANATLTQAPPETDPALEAAAAAARRKIEVLRTEVPANGCHATVEVLLSGMRAGG